MSNVLEYTLSLQDRISATLRTIGVNSGTALDRFSALQRRSQEVSRVMSDMGRSAGSLRMQLELLREERDWIPEDNIQDVRRYNDEIRRLERQIRRLDEATGQSRLGRWARDAFANIPGAGLLANPLVAIGGAMAYSAKEAMSFDEGMAKINTTAQLSAEGVADLKDRLLQMGLAAGADPTKLPDAYEKIISQTGDVEQSAQILEAALKGSKAGFTDVDVVAGALAQTLSIVGAENANAAEVLDTLFAAKRVGAGEFADFAAYMPQLVASGDALGIKYKEVAGLFAYMTGKGQSAERASTLMGNAFSALGKKDIQDELSKAGVKIFDKGGAMRDITDIIGDLKKRMAGLSDKGKSNFLERMGLVDKEAKAAMLVMVSDTEKLQEAMHDTRDAVGEADNAFKASANPLQKVEKLWGKIKTLAIGLGGTLLTVMAPALDVVNVAFDGLLWLAGHVAPALAWIRNELAGGNPWIWAAATALTALAAGMTVAWIWANRLKIETAALWVVTKLKAAWDAIATVAIGLGAIATGNWALAQTALNGSMLANPLTWVIALVVALIGVIAYVIYAYDGWGKAWGHLVNYLKLSWEEFKIQFELVWLKVRNGFLDGIDSMKKAWYSFQSLWDEDGANAGLAAINSRSQERAQELANAHGRLGEVQEKMKAEAAQVKVERNGKTLSGLIDGVKEKAGIAAPTLPGMGKPISLEDGTGADDTGGKDKKKKGSAESIATGGTKNTTIHITIGKQVGIENFSGTAEGGAQQSAQQILDQVTRYIKMGAALGG